MESYSAMKKNKILTRATARTDLENIMPSEGSNTKKTHGLRLFYEMSSIGIFVEMGSKFMFKREKVANDHGYLEGSEIKMLPNSRV